VANAHSLTLPAESPDWALPSRRKIGVISLIVTETALFTIFAVAYLFYIGKSLSGPYPAEVLELPILATICLLGSSATIMLAERAFRREANGSFRLWWLITIGLALFFLCSTALEWRRLIYQHNLTIGWYEPLRYLVLLARRIACHPCCCRLDFTCSGFLV
jgi:cytochrome c oxidase subunit 3/cytochrome o ubiquinol oxidase subunit 3